MKDHAFKSITKEDCLKSAKKYRFRKDWRFWEPSYFNKAKKEGWYDECVSHMTLLSKKRTKEECLNEAKKYKTIKEWKKGSSKTYTYARTREYYKECISHMDYYSRRSVKKWTYEKVMKTTIKHKTFSEWYKYFNSAYRHALRKGFLDDIKDHFKRKNQRIDNDMVHEICNKPIQDK